MAAAFRAAAHRGLEFMREAQVEVRFGRHGDVHAALAGTRTYDAWRARGSRSVPFTDNWTGPRLSHRCGAKANDAGPHEIMQWPTKCSSTLPIRRRPGWSSCGAIASKNSILNPHNASS